MNSGISKGKVTHFLLGAQKAGTTTLYSWLSQHPEIDAPESIKDFHFFTSQEYFAKGYKWFGKHYRDEGAKIRINGAVNYIFQAEAPRIIWEYNPDAKFLLVLRNPVKRAFSAYCFFEKLGLEKFSFEKAIEREQLGRLGSLEEKDHYAYLAHGLYYQQLRNWFSYFEKDKFLILIYEELFKYPDIYLNKIFHFLNVAPDFKPILEIKNVSGEVKYKTLNTLIYDNESVLKRFVNKSGVKHLVPIEWRGTFLNKFRDFNTKKESVSEKMTEERYNELLPLFREDSEKLSELLGKDLKGIWKY